MTGIRQLTEQDRRARAEANEGLPTLAFDATTPYDDYVGTEVLHQLQRPVTDVPEELSFLVTTQVMELYFGLLRSEWLLAQRQLDADDASAATQTIRRTVRHFQALNAAWASLSWLTPAQFNGFRDALGEGSGFQSALYRHVEFLLGNKSEALIRPHRRNPRAHRELVEALHRPSLYDSVLAFLARAGYPIPRAVLERDPVTEYEPDPAVEKVWAEVYAGPLAPLAEALTDLAEQFSDWRYRHVMAVRRSMGAKPGSGGSNGLSWLERSMRRQVFPELWTARTLM
ncbi:tryptophan 2,3-dioxygenase [Streptosporangium becharense]|uniref:Tryptophan 2,3-dioxygenase n=1 Tax=Streptosporangium becharense TaxID=1816182 RepID=A0A7W9IMG4_9ACTN|nr:tryptophan 2,3-dioxygenase family protein [Streptosporangium becharense]MBB2911438.1 tryptophan 2,3-dioxygenase [Streptosporangium becharense]MBB5822744.1 tryptophan 2,3-dioxygenase [Streptosporangium becharense]